MEASGSIKLIDLSELLNEVDLGMLRNLFELLNEVDLGILSSLTILHDMNIKSNITPDQLSTGHMVYYYRDFIHVSDNDQFGVHDMRKRFPAEAIKLLVERRYKQIRGDLNG